MLYDDYYADLNKQIIDYAAISVDEQTLTFGITFAKPSDISKDINDFDILSIEFLLREQIIDAETFSLIEETELKQEVDIVP